LDKCPSQPRRVAHPTLLRATTRQAAEGRMIHRGASCVAQFTERGNFRGDVEGLRAVAVLAVFVFHLSPTLLPAGFVGVDVFFVISGCLITDQIRRGHESGKFSYQQFYQRRIARIAPAGLFVILCVLAVAAVLYEATDLVGVAVPAFSSTLGLLNLQLLRHEGYFETRSDTAPLLHYWSLSVEEQFYLVYPVLLVAVLRTRRPMTFILAAACISLALSVALTPLYPDLAFYSLPTRAWEFLVGAAVTFIPSRKRDYTVPATMLGIASLLFVRAQNFPGVEAILPVAAVALLLSGSEDSRAGRLLAHSVMRWLGRRSYVLYLWHWPIFCFVDYSLYDAPAWQRLILKVSASGLLTVGSHAILERPARAWLRHPSMRRTAFVGLGAGVLVVAIASIACYRWPLAQATRWEIPRGGRVANKNGRPEIVIIGDSVIAAQGRTMVSIGKQLGANVRIYALSGMNEMPGEADSLWPEIYPQVERSRPSLIVLGEDWINKYDRLGPAHLRGAIATIACLTDHLIIIGQPPQPPALAVDRSAWRAGYFARAVEPAAVARKRARIEAAFTSLANPRIHFLPVAAPFVLDSGEVAIRDGRRFLFMDQRHLTQAGSDKLRPLFQDAFARALRPTIPRRLNDSSCPASGCTAGGNCRGPRQFTRVRTR
jgi:peptidoglycan/LPS O-acetylase OafA/YrhL